MTTRHVDRPRRTPEQRAFKARALYEARQTTAEMLRALLPDCHPADRPSIQDMIDSIDPATRYDHRWSMAELEAAVRLTEASARKDTSPVTPEEAARIKGELQDLR